MAKVQRVRLTFGILAVALTVSAPARSQDAAAQDLACMAVTMLAGSRMTDSTAKEGVMAGFAYYMGRVKGREPGIDLRARLIAQTKRLLAEPDRLSSEAGRCGEDLKAWGLETRELGKALTEEGVRLQGPPAT
ncbi:MAG: hypothetical protein U1C74_00955 [Phenylobacterium sp.]|nr:hypothetical protein [Phenylobacterium sp.]